MGKDFRTLLKLILTRSNTENEKLEAKLKAEAFETLSLPCIEYSDPRDNYSSLDQAIRKNHEYEWVFFLSERAAKNLFERLLEIGGNLFNLAPHLKIACIGSKTEKYIKETIGFPVDFVPSKFNTNDFIKEFSQIFKKDFYFEGKPLYPSKKILIPRMPVEDRVFIEKLKAINLEVDEVMAYETYLPELNEKTELNLKKLKKAIEKQEEIIILLSSSQVVKNFKELSKGLEFQKNNIRFISIGPKTTETLKEEFSGCAIEESEESSIESMLKSTKLIETS